MSTISAGTTSSTTLVATGDTAGTLVFKTNDTGSGGTTAMTINTSQNVGIGTSAPVAGARLAVVGGPVQLSGGTTAQAGLRVQYASSVATITGINNDNNAFNPIAFYTSATEAMRIDTSGVLSFNSGYGSVAAAYGCRSWVNFNGTGTVAIRASANVSSITDNGTGDYTINFTTAMTDANYSVAYSCAMWATNNNSSTVLIYGSLAGGASGKTSSALRITTGQPQTTTFHDNAEVNVSIFR